mmetsp:Transcript_106263/g.317530  ORF Transcript_106263/g.317530 Transcript_106263/m.317530 type:complete len:260 (-) Transcript_106263:113-892(-)
MLFVAHVPKLVDRLRVRCLLGERVELDVAAPIQQGALCIVAQTEGVLPVPRVPEAVHGLRPLRLRLVGVELAPELVLSAPGRVEVEGVLAIARVPKGVDRLDVALVLFLGRLEGVQDGGDVGLAVQEAVELQVRGDALARELVNLHRFPQRQARPPHVEVEHEVIDLQHERPWVAWGVRYGDVLDLQATLEGVEAQVADVNVNAKVILVELLHDSCGNLDEDELQQEGAEGHHGDDRKRCGQPAGQRGPWAAEEHHCQH